MTLNEARLHSLFSQSPALRDLVHSGALESVKPGETPAPKPITFPGRKRCGCARTISANKEECRACSEAAEAAA